MNMLTVSSFPRIIEIIHYLGRDLMEILESLNEMVQLIGVPGVVVILWAVMPLLLTILLVSVVTIGAKQLKENNQAFNKQIESLTNAITMLTDRVMDPPLCGEDSLDYFYLVMKDHILQKLRYLGDILRANSIYLREKQIKKNIENEFKAITTKEANKLSRKKSMCGDMGKVLQENIDWPSFLFEVYEVFFTKKDNGIPDADHLKIKDIEKIMHGKVDIIAKIIEDNGAHN